MRLDAGMSLRELEHQSGVSRGTLSRIENGVLIPTDEQSVAIGDVFGVTFRAGVFLVEVES